MAAASTTCPPPSPHPTSTPSSNNSLPPELARALSVAINCLLTEIRHANPTLADKLQETLVSLVPTPNC